MLWAGSDYAKTRVYYEQAIVQAYLEDDLTHLAYALNSMGNWHINSEQPEQALTFHREALKVFEQEKDPRGIAETLDFLGMASSMAGDVVKGVDYYRQAIQHFESLDDRRMLAHCLATITLGGNGTYQSQHLLSQEASLEDNIRQLEQANQICEEIHWQSGKVYVAFLSGSSLGPLGEINRAISVLTAGIELAEEIHHRQWFTACHTVLAQVYLDIFAYAKAYEHASLAEAHAQEIASSFFTRISKSLKAQACLHQGDFAAAERLLDEVIPISSQPRTMTERQAVCVRAQIALAASKPDECIALLEKMYPKEIYTLESGDGVIPYLSMRYGEALFSLGQTDTAEKCLRGAVEASRKVRSKSIEWRAHRDLSRLYRSTHQFEPSDREKAAAITIVDQIAGTIPDPSMAKSFLEHAYNSLEEGNFQ
jgi:tetratricopeptide (TPR) repeat protein